MIMTTRRGFVLGAASLAAACDNSVGSPGSQTIDRRVTSTLSYMYSKHPETTRLRDTSSGMLVMPLIGEAGFMVGGSYGEGALLIDGATVDYYSATQATVGFQFGAQQYAYVLFFMTPEALQRFRTSPGWAAGAAAEFTGGDIAGALSADTVTQNAVVALLFAQQGLMIGATIDGTKYTRILR
ncbi:YSC84-related protein [Pseudoruegeria sp. SK021]|uniref:lipid-binding SYLF domain-containing protein n=1 Tax=Pseudoruegeria sp. SK021 TaxID=1933035 RepID=UPI000A2467FC|nr:lipid-binding SYLF domain-containing protein [Pseudoruegeria sp. SK021]OSP55264.1 twin-arginine translocation pathway signal [Pseudoruegeria sp. SK021]